MSDQPNLITIHTGRYDIQNNVNTPQKIRKDYPPSKSTAPILALKLHCLVLFIEVTIILMIKLMRLIEASKFMKR